MSDNGLLIAKGSSEQYLLPAMANRHGLITGATGTGKTVTLQVIAESFSSIGVPVFLSDIKGDLSGICEAGEDKPKMQERIQMLGLENFSFQGYPVQFWDVFGEQGLPVRTTISEMGPLLLARLLHLNEVQSGVLNLVFRIADDMGLLLLDIKDLKSMLAYVAENAKEYTVEYGTVSRQSIGAIQRSLLVIEEQGGDIFFGEPAMGIKDLIKTDPHGLGTINILASDKLFSAPALYSTFLLWLLSELFEELPEVGDMEKPKMVFFFDEAHLLFDDAPKILLDKIEQVVRLIRSKGVGVYFISQNPIDIPDSVLGQLGNRVQHALRGYTPKDQKAIRAAAETFRQNPNYSVEQVITELGVGEALVSFLDGKGRPSVVERAFILPPHSLIGPVSQQRRQKEYAKSPLKDQYEETIDRDSAYEHLQKRAEQEAKRAEALEQEEVRQEAKRARSTSSRTNSGRRSTSGRKPASMIEKMAKSAADTLGRQVGRELVRGILGSILRGGK
ncbi:putative ATPase [Desulfitobacterium dichloroeliminans LMG P-21439]|uniref:Putative ATPase n=1 Tax=Desulfitobacterium dichloroeliminans (strain LMG P-21439 / DCA1) TaxID=871963 RepID=L0F4V3_DESDL|nr:helicase HerA-like domain-containing protein [Desulfitobacterium dichloroeliminans]AGA67696.1 putative ATPase [Desulfitobacterium dichloroeliminans LMG P-21439]